MSRYPISLNSFQLQFVNAFRHAKTHKNAKKEKIERGDSVSTTKQVGWNSDYLDTQTLAESEEDIQELAGKVKNMNVK